MPFPDVPLQNLKLPQNGLTACCCKVYGRRAVPGHILIIPATGLLVSSHYCTRRSVPVLPTDAQAKIRKRFSGQLLHRGSSGPAWPLLVFRVPWRSEQRCRPRPRDGTEFGLQSLDLRWVSMICPYHAACVGCECILRDREPSPVETYCILLDEQIVTVCPALG